MERGGQRDAPVRDLYCIVPVDLANELHELLRGHFRADPSVHVIVERRAGDRRQMATRRSRGAVDVLEADSERRRIKSDRGRRAGERRSMAAPIGVGELPRKARAHAGRLLFVERLRPSDSLAEDVEANRSIALFQSGDLAGFSELYLRYFDRVYSYMRVALRQQHEAEDAVQQVFTQVFEALPRYQIRGGKPFRAWLFRIARNDLLKRLEKRSRVDVVDPDVVDRGREAEAEDADALRTTLDWVSDHELLLFIERLPEVQRQVLALRYMLGLSTEEISQVLGRSPDAIRQLQSRALRFLEQRLTAVGRAPVRAGRLEPALVMLRQAPVLRSRRFVLAP